MEPVGKERFSVIAAFGAGIALTATVAGIYTKIKATERRRKKRELLASKLDILHETVEQLRKDVEEIKIASMRGSPLSMQPLDVDHLEAELQAEIENDIGRIHSPTNYNKSSPSRHYNSNKHSPSIRNRVSGLRQERKMLEPINSDPYTSSDETEEFFDFNDSDSNLNGIEPGIIRATSEDHDLDENSLSGGDVTDFIGKPLGSSETNDDPLCNNISVKSIEPSQDDYLKEIDACIDTPKVDVQNLYDKLCSMEEKFGTNAQILWRKAKVCHLLGPIAEKQGNKGRKRELTFEKLEHAKKALELDDQSVETHKWYAIAIGAITDYVGTKEKIENGYEFKKHLDFALNLKPEDSTLHHLLGRWAFEVSNLSWLEKKLASSLFAQVPETSADEALQSLMQAYKIKPEWKQNIYYICKTLIALKRTKEAVEWIEKGLNCRIEDDDDQMVHEKLLNLKSKYGK